MRAKRAVFGTIPTGSTTSGGRADMHLDESKEERPRREVDEPDVVRSLRVQPREFLLRQRGVASADGSTRLTANETLHARSWNGDAESREYLRDASRAHAGCSKRRRRTSSSMTCGSLLATDMARTTRRRPRSIASSQRMIPSGTRIAVRAQSTITDATDRLFDVMLLGVD